MPINFKALTSQTISSRCQNWAFPIYCISAFFITIFSVEVIHHWPNYFKWPSILLACTLPIGMVILGWTPTWLSEQQMPKEILWALLMFSLALISSILSENYWATIKTSTLFMVSGPFIFVITKYLFESAKNREAYLWITSLILPALCFMGIYQYYSSGGFYLFAKNPLPDLGLLLLLSASPLILFHREQTFALKLVLGLIIILLATAVILSAKKGPFLSLLAISLCLIVFNFRKYYKGFLILTVFSGLFLYFSAGTFQKFKGATIAFANLIFVEPDYSKFIYDQVWATDQATEYIYAEVTDLNKIAWNELSVEEREVYKKMLKDRNIGSPNVDLITNAASLKKLFAMPDRQFIKLNILTSYWQKLNREPMMNMLLRQREMKKSLHIKILYDQIWNKDLAGNFTLKNQESFDPYIWQHAPPWEKGVLIRILKARDIGWPKVDHITNAASLKKLFAMPDRQFMKTNIPVNYWQKLDKDSMRKVQARQKMIVQSNNGMAVVGHLHAPPQKSDHRNDTTKSFLGPIPHVNPEALWSFTIRIEHYFFALHLFKKNPVWGLGFKANLVQHLENYDTHFLINLPNVAYKGYISWHQTFENVLLMFLVELGGLFTLIYFGGVLYIVISCTKKILAFPQENIAGMLTVSTLIGFAILSITFDTLRFPSLNWIFHSLLGLLINLVIKRSHENSKNSLRL